MQSGESKRGSPRTSRLRDAHLQKGRRRLELRIRRFSSSSCTNGSTPASLISSFITTDSQRSISAWSSKKRAPFERTTVRRRFLFLLLWNQDSSAVVATSPKVLPRVGNNVFRFANRDIRMHSVHPLQHELQVLCSSFLVRPDRQKFPIFELCRDFRILFSRPLQGCCCNVDSCSNLSFESEQLLLKLNHHVLHRSHRSSPG